MSLSSPSQPFDTRRIPLFLFGCILTRIALAAAAYLLPERFLPFMGCLALVPGLGFLAIWIFGLRKTGPETLGAPIWWNPLRPVHAAFYLLFAYLALRRNRHAWVMLAADASLGLIAWLIYLHSTQLRLK